MTLNNKCSQSLKDSIRILSFTNPFSQALGLRFRKPEPRTLYLFDFGKPVRHKFSMWFVFHTIDVHFLDEELDVVDQKLGFRPFTAYKPRKQYRYAVESAPGVVRSPFGFRRLLKRKL